MIVFHHIPKTGGVSIITNIINSNPQLKVSKKDNIFPSRHLEQIPDNSCDFLHGHFNYSEISSNSIKFAFFRHPITRLSSTFYACKKLLKNSGIANIRNIQSPILDFCFVGDARIKIHKNQVWFLDRIEDFIDVFLYTKGTFNIKFIPELFVPDYGNSYDFIGITEKMNESIIKLNKFIKTDVNSMTVSNTSNSIPITYRLKELEDFYCKDIEKWQEIYN